MYLKPEKARNNDRAHSLLEKGIPFGVSLPVEAKKRSSPPPPHLSSTHVPILVSVWMVMIFLESNIYNIWKRLNKRGLANSTFHFFSFTTCSSSTESFDEQKQQLAVMASLNVLKISLRVSWNSVCLNA